MALLLYVLDKTGLFSEKFFKGAEMPSVNLNGKPRTNRGLCVVGALLAGLVFAADVCAREPAKYVDVSEGRIRRFHEDNLEKLFTVPEKLWVKSVVTETREQAEEAYRRAKVGEDFDELMAEYFVPFFFAGRQKVQETKSGIVGLYIDKWTEQTDVIRERFWCEKGAKGPLVGMKVGDIRGPMLRYGKGPEWAILKLAGRKEGYVIPFEQAKDRIYARFWDELADPQMMHEVKTGKNMWCGTCRVGYHLNYQLWELAQRYDREGDIPRAISACLLGLHEARGRPLGHKPVWPNKKGYYPDEEYLMGLGMDLVRYYGGRGKVRMRIKDERVVQQLMQKAKKGGLEGSKAAQVLSWHGVREVIPILREMLRDEYVQICELSAGWDKKTVYAYYRVRSEAKESLERLGEEVGDVKIVIGKIFRTEAAKKDAVE